MTTPIIPPLEPEFSEKLYHFDESNGKYTLESLSAVKSFITARDQKILANVREVVEGTRKKCSRMPGDESQCAGCWPYNQALADILAALEQVEVLGEDL